TTEVAVVGRPGDAEPVARLDVALLGIGAGDLRGEQVVADAPALCDEIRDVPGLGREADDVAFRHGDAPIRPQHVHVGAGDLELQVQGCGGLVGPRRVQLGAVAG